jgi:hypothetical protein
VVSDGEPTVSTGFPAEFQTALAPVPDEDKVTLKYVVACATLVYNNVPVANPSATPPASNDFLFTRIPGLLGSCHKKCEVVCF